MPFLWNNYIHFNEQRFDINPLNSTFLGKNYILFNEHRITSHFFIIIDQNLLCQVCIHVLNAVIHEVFGQGVEHRTSIITEAGSYGTTVQSVLQGSQHLARDVHESLGALV